MKAATGYSARSFATKVDLSSIVVILVAIVVAVAVVRQSFFALAALALVGLAVLFPVETALGTFAIFVPFDQILVFENSDFTFAWFSGAFAGAILLIYGAMSGRFRLPTRPGFYWGLFVFWTVISLAWALDPATSVNRLPTVAALFGLYIVAANFQIAKPELSRIMLLTVVGGVGAAALIIFQFLNGISFEGRASLVISGVEGNPNELAASLLLPASLALCGALAEGSRLKKGAMLASLIPIAASIFLSMSRGSILALLATLLTCMVLSKSGLRKRLVPVLVLAVPLVFLPSLFYQRLGETLSGRGTGRYDIWIAGLEIVKNHPVLGVGLACFPLAYTKVAGYAHVFPSHGYMREAHNAYLQVCAETGLIGLVLFIVAIATQIKEAHLASSTRDSTYPAVALQAAAWGQLVAALSGNIQWNKSFWLVFILLSLVSQQHDKVSDLIRPNGKLREQTSY